MIMLSVVLYYLGEGLAARSKAKKIPEGTDFVPPEFPDTRIHLRHEEKIARLELLGDESDQVGQTLKLAPGKIGYFRMKESADGQTQPHITVEHEL